MLKIAIYYHNYSTLGHVTKIFSLVRYLHQSLGGRIKIIVIETGNSRIASGSLRNYADVYFFPRSIMPGQGGDTGKSNRIFKSNTTRLLRLLGDFTPQIFITEYYPFAQNLSLYPELPYILNYLKFSLKSKIVSSCTYPNWNDDLRRLIENYYDAILIHWPHALSSGYRQYLPRDGISVLDGIFSDFRRKVFFTGFLLEKMQADKRIADSSKKKIGLKKGQKLIVISRGGRREYGKVILYMLLIAKRHPEWYFLISAGALARDKKISGIASGLNNVALKEVIFPDFDSYLIASDLSISMGGYNTVMRIIYYKKKSILIPAPNTEQAWNASLAQRRVGSVVLRWPVNGPVSLENNISQMLSSKINAYPEVKRREFCGLENSAKIIGRLL